MPGEEERLVGHRPRRENDARPYRTATMLRAPIMRRSEQNTLARLQRQLARCGKGSLRRGKVKARIAKLHAAVADRRKDWVEKTTTQITATYGVVAVEKLPIRNMVRAPKPKPDPDNAGGYLPERESRESGAQQGDLRQLLGFDRPALGTQNVRVWHSRSSRCRPRTAVWSAATAATARRKTVRAKRNSSARNVATKTMRTFRQQTRSSPGPPGPRTPPDRRQHPLLRVCSRKREDPPTRTRHRESRDLQSREKVKRLVLNRVTVYIVEDTKRTRQRSRGVTR